MAKIKFEIRGDKPSFTSARFWAKILIMSLSIIITSYLFSIAQVSGVFSAILAALVISILNAFIKPILVLFSLPLMVLSLGLFNLVINAFIVMFADYILGDRFIVYGFGDAFLFSIIITIIAFLLEIPDRILRTKKQFEEGFNQTRVNTRQKTIFTDYEDITDTEDEEKVDKDKNGNNE